MITDKLRGEQLVHNCVCFLIQLGLLYTIVRVLFFQDSISFHFNDPYRYKIFASYKFEVLLAKLLCSCALHLCLFPHIKRTRLLMKYIINHPEKFTHSHIAFHIAHDSYCINVMVELINIYMLAYQKSVEICIINFVALQAIAHVPFLYMGTISDDKLRLRLFSNNKSLKVTNRGEQIEWSQRTFHNKVERIIYKVHRSIYVSVIFYFSPFIVIWLQSNTEPGIFKSSQLL